MTDTKKNDPLEAILVDEVTQQNRARELLASILVGRVEIDSRTGTLELLPGAYGSSVSSTILVLLCGKLAQKLLAKNLGKEDSEINEKMTQKEITEFLTTVEAGTIKSSLHNLRDKDHLIKNDGGKNFVTLSQLQKIKDKFSVENTKREKKG